MTNNIFLQKYQHLQYRIMYNKLVDLDFASLAWCRKYVSSVFNHAQIDEPLTDSQLKEIEKKLRFLKRKPAIYFENKKELSELIEFLGQKGYNKEWEDSWMFYVGKKVEKDGFDIVKKVENEVSLAEFLETFDACYQKNDPQNPYGELGDYLDVAKKSWYKHNESGKIEYFTVYQDKKPVAVSTLTNFAGIGYISNVGSIKEVRGQGFGKIASLYSVYKSINNGNIEHALATEEGHYPNEFYKRIGFKTRFTAIGYVKKKNE